MRGLSLVAPMKWEKTEEVLTDDEAGVQGGGSVGEGCWRLKLLRTARDDQVLATGARRNAAQ
jgi:hypothetical protein